jgi:hypothetical protein
MNDSAWTGNPGRFRFSCELLWQISTRRVYSPPQAIRPRGFEPFDCQTGNRMSEHFRIVYCDL